MPITHIRRPIFEISVFKMLDLASPFRVNTSSRKASDASILAVMSPATIEAQTPPTIDMDSEHFSPYRQGGKLYGFVCVVTGTTQPIGKAIAKELAGES
jgi:hypothetical protein